MPTLIIAILQLSLSLLVTARTSTLSPATYAQAVTTASQGIQTASLALKTTPGASDAVKAHTWINVNALMDGDYVNNGKLIHLADSHYLDGSHAIELAQGYMSFGDLTNDNDMLDDAVVILKNTDTVAGKTTYMYELAAMINGGGKLYNIANLPLGDIVEVFDHHIIEKNRFHIDYKTADGKRTAATYKVVGDKFVKE